MLAQTELQLVPEPPERTLEFVVLRALGDPGVAPCPVCGGHLDEVDGGVECADCGSEIVRVVVVDDSPIDNVVRLQTANHG